MLERIASETLAAWYRHLQSRETWSRDRLASLAGRSARYRMGPLSLCLAVQQDGTVAAGPDEPIEPSVSIVLDPAGLAQSVTDPAALLRNMKVDGDVEFARVFTETLSRLRPEPAEDLSRWIGDAPAQRLVDLANQALQAARDIPLRATRQATEFATAEAGLLVGRPEFLRCRDEVLALKQRLEQIEATVGGARPPRP